MLLTKDFSLGLVTCNKVLIFFLYINNMTRNCWDLILKECYTFVIPTVLMKTPVKKKHTCKTFR
jgi:hypothetical protein